MLPARQRARLLAAISISAAVASAVLAQDSTRGGAPAKKNAPRRQAAARQARDTTARRDTAAKPKRRLCAGTGPQSCDTVHRAFKDTALDRLWPVSGPAPLPGSILPAKRIVAFYGNPNSRRMGILGEFGPDTMLRKLDSVADVWRRVDPKTPVQPALHLIAVVAQAGPGKDRKYRLRMDSSLIETVYGWAKSRNAIMFVDVQVGHSTLQQELPWLERFLRRPDVHLGIDPEFSMKNTTLAPGKKIGTYDAADVNYASRFLAELVDKYKLPPKVLIVHRFTRKGVTNYKDIKLDPRVQIVMHMDGFGAPWLKRDSFWSYVKKEPVQFVGWKQFTKRKNDNPPTPEAAVFKLFPTPVYVQYQ